jgi:hypothetical protein
MPTARRSLLLFALCGSLLFTFFVMAEEQNPPAAAPTPPAPQKLSLTAALVLTPEFCGATIRKKHGPVPLPNAVGQAACTQFEPALRDIFTSLTPVDNPSKPGDVQVVLVPKFSNVSFIPGAYTFQKGELLLLLEWTVTDPAGKVITVEIVQTSAKRGMGNNMTLLKNLHRLVQDTVQLAAGQSAAKLSSSEALLDLSAPTGNK